MMNVLKSLPNRIVRKYIERWSYELDRIRFESIKIQHDQLRRILRSQHFIHLNNTFDRGTTTYRDFERSFEISTYSIYSNRIKRLMESGNVKCEYFAQSSGTSSAEKKLIPTPETFVRMNHLRGSWYVLNALYSHDRDMTVFGSKNLLIGGSIYQQNKIHIVGDVSGIMLYRIPYFFRPFYVPAVATAVIPEWQEKIDSTARAASKQSDISLLGGTPTWVLTVLSKVMEETGISTLTELWPGLQAYIHGGVSFEPYRPLFEKLIPKDDFNYLEVYNASEGFFAFQDKLGQEGLLLMTANGIFYEFVEYQAYRDGNLHPIPLWEVKLKTQYVLLITTYSGLSRYIVGDVVEFVNIQPYRIRILGRVTDYINAFGEDLSLSQAENAMIIVNRSMGVEIANFTVAPFYLDIGVKGYHEWYIEFKKQPNDLIEYERRLDVEIQKNCPNYCQKRYRDLAIEMLKVKPLPTGSFEAYLNRNGNINGQSKIPLLKNDRSIANFFKQDRYDLRKVVQQESYE